MEEVLILESIYGDEWKTIDEHSYSIEINENSRIIDFQVTLPTSYPETSPPQYQLGAPWLGNLERNVLNAKLNYIYLDNIGEQVIYPWIESIREHLCNYRHDDEEAMPGGEGTDCPVSGGVATVSTCTSSAPSDLSSAPEIHSTEVVTDRKSKFQGHLARITDFSQVASVLAVLMSDRKIASATHNIAAYRLQDREDHLDDGEKGASVQMLRLMQTVEAVDVMVVVTRWYGGIQLGPDRFKHINALCKRLLQEHEFIIKEKKCKSKKKKK